MRNVGIAATALLATRCTLPTFIDDGSPRGRLRRCWQRLDWLSEVSSDYARGEQALEELASDHRAALNDLVAAGELSSEAASCLQSAFMAGGTHILLVSGQVTCYEPVIIDYTPASSSQLVRQAETLAEMAAESDLDPTTVAQVQATIERDIAFLNQDYERTQQLYDELIAAAGDSYNFPAFSELDLDISPAVQEATSYLVELLLD